MSRARNSSVDAASKRLYVLGAFLLLWSMLIVGRLVQLQVFRFDRYQHEAAQQQERDSDIAPPRGLIFDRNGKELALSAPAQSVQAFPKDIPDLHEKLTMVASVAGLDANDLIARCEGRNSCWVARKLDPAIGDRINELKLAGFTVQPDTRRWYPNDILASQVLGWVDLDDKGQSGIESQFEEDLRGEPGRMKLSVDARRRHFGSVEQEPEPGKNIVLTLDKTIQYIAERELDKAMQETHAHSGMVIVENPHTGEILALANSPTFNPNSLKGVDARALQNPAVSFPYEPGSTFKIITVSAALEDKLTRPDEMIDCGNGSIVVGGLRIHDHKSYSSLSVADVIANSSDVGAIRLAERLGKERLDHYIHAYGLGTRTGIELPSETRGMTRDVRRWNPSSIGAISMGQEIGLSAVQLAGVLSTIANDGVLVPPRIVAATTPPQSGIKAVVFKPAESRRVISTTTAAEMKQMLQGVVLHGTGRKALLQGYTSAGKTGTAQRKDEVVCAAAAEAARNHVPGPKCRYSKTDYVGSFAGFAPVNNPAVVIAVILDSAKGLHQGGQVAAPVFTRIAQQVLEHLSVPRDVDVPMSRQMLLAMKRSTQQDLNDAALDAVGEPLATDSDEDTDPGNQGIRVATGPQSYPPIDLKTDPKTDPRVIAVAAHASASPGYPPASSATGAGQIPSSNVAQPNESSSSSSRNSGGMRGGVQTLDTASSKVSGLAGRASGETHSLGGGVVVALDQDAIVVPSFTGKRMREVIEAAEEAGLVVEPRGSGVARQQLPMAGAKVRTGAHVVIQFSR